MPRRGRVDGVEIDGRACLRHNEALSNLCGPVLFPYTGCEINPPQGAILLVQLDLPRPSIGPAISRRLVLGLTLLAVASCAPGGDLPPLPPLADTAYRLGPGDRVRIITFGEQQLTGDFKVSDSGVIALPLLRPIEASGLTSRQLADVIAAELKRRNLFRDPSVVVEISDYRPIFILGEVSKPGQYPYQPGMTVLTAVAVAGGFTYRAVKDDASVLRNEGGAPAAGLATGATLLQPGDVVTIFERRF
jgi:polysaccharide biosynthesis/export protein